MNKKDIRTHNRKAWDKQVEEGNMWTIPVSPDVIAKARQGDWGIVLTPQKQVPKEWFGELKGRKVLCLASGGGQQAPVLAAVGAKVTVLDNSPAQLAQDRMVAERDGLSIETVEGDMADMHMFDNETFDLIFHPVSNVFVPEVRPVWKEAYRVLKPGGVLLSGITNPAVYLFDWDLADSTGKLHVKYKLPYSEPDVMTEEKRQKYIEKGWPWEFSHTLEDQIGGQLEAGFVLTAFFEDKYPEGTDDALNEYMSKFIAMRAIKP